MKRIKVGHAYKVYSNDHYVGTLKCKGPEQCVLRLIGNDFDIEGSESGVMEVLQYAYGNFEVLERYASTMIFSQKQS